MLRFCIALLILAATPLQSVAEIRFTPGTSITVQRAPSLLALGDLDDDGIAEVVVGSPASNMLAVLSVLADGSLTPRRNITLGRNLAGLAVVDVDADGRNDVLIADASGGARNGDLLWLRSTGPLDFDAPLVFPLSVFALRAFAAGDFDGDGFPDAAIVTGTRRQIALSRNIDGAEFASQPLLERFEREPRGLRAGRFDATGRDSLVVINTNTNREHELVVLGYEGPTFGLPGLPLPLAATAPVDVITGDFNGDGHLDFAVLHAQADRAFYVTTFLNRPQFSAPGATSPGSFLMRSPLAFDCPADAGGTLTRCVPQTLAAGDFDADGRVDLIVAINSPPRLYLLGGLGDGGFDLAGRISVGGGQTFGALAAADVSGDGVPDVVVTDTGSNAVTLLRAEVPQRKPLGSSCLAGGECVSLACVDGVCCGSSACASGERCDVPGRAGFCEPLAPLGTGCASAAVCASSFCTDGVCCVRANCGPGLSCFSDLPGQCGLGVATPTPTRPVVPGATPTPLGLGAPCSAAGQCATGRCVDGRCCNENCSTGLFCNLSGEEGTCRARRFIGEPCAKHDDCVAERCGEGGLCALPVTPSPTPVRSSPGSLCAVADECQTGHCTDGVCCFEPACAVGERCDITGMRGDCRPRLEPGATCGRNSDCRGDGPCLSSGGASVCAAPSETPGPRACFGDCSGDGQVTVNEILVLIEIALGAQPIASCANGDIDGDGQISVDELLTAVSLALAGC